MSRLWQKAGTGLGEFKVMSSYHWMEKGKYKKKKRPYLYWGCWFQEQCTMKEMYCERNESRAV